MDRTQLDLVRTTFAGIATMPDVAGALFYERLFAETPAFRAMFKHDMRVQAVKLMTMLEMIVNNLDRPEDILPTVRELAMRHVEYGVRPADYDAVRDALLWTLEQALGDAFDSAAREAWTRCYDELASAMKTAAAP